LCSELQHEVDTLRPLKSGLVQKDDEIEKLRRELVKVQKHLAESMEHLNQMTNSEDSPVEKYVPLSYCIAFLLLLLFIK